MLFATSTTNAQTATSRGDRAKIRHGLKGREITRDEAVSVVKSERKIRKEVRAAKADGVVTPEERKDIRKHKIKVDRKIRRVKHNRRNRN